MQEQHIQHIRAAAWAPERPKEALLEVLAEVAEPLARAEINSGHSLKKAGRAIKACQELRTIPGSMSLSRWRT